MISEDTSTTEAAPHSEARATGQMLLDQIEAAEAREGNIRRMALIGAICIATLLLPVIYLRLTGNLTHLRDRLFPPKHVASTIGIADRNVDPIARDLNEYMRHSIPSLAPLEERALKDFNSVTGPNSKGDAVFVQVVHDKVLPEYRAYLDAVNQIHPKTPAVTAIHAIFVQCAQRKLSAFTLIAAGAGRTADPAWQKMVREDLAQSDAANKQFLERLDNLQQAYMTRVPSSEIR